MIRALCAAFAVLAFAGGLQAMADLRLPRRSDNPREIGGVVTGFALSALFTALAFILP